MSERDVANRQKPSARHRPLLAAFAVAAIGGLSAATALVMEHPAWGVLSAVGLFAATWRFFIPEQRGDARGESALPALRHAFAVDPPGPAEPTPEERPVVEALVREVVRRRMEAPAMMFLEMSRPLNYVASQTLSFFMPMLSAIGDARGASLLAAFLERRGSIDWLLQRLEESGGEPPGSNSNGPSSNTDE